MYVQGYNGLGVLYWNGQGVPANLSAAFHAFEQGAKLNNPDSLYNLATMYANGVHIEKNETMGGWCCRGLTRAGRARSGVEGEWCYSANTCRRAVPGL